MQWSVTVTDSWRCGINFSGGNQRAGCGHYCHVHYAELRPHTLAESRRTVPSPGTVPAFVPLRSSSADGPYDWFRLSGRLALFTVNDFWESALLCERLARKSNADGTTQYDLWPIEPNLESRPANGGKHMETDGKTPRCWVVNCHRSQLAWPVFPLTYDGWID